MQNNPRSLGATTMTQILAINGVFLNFVLKEGV